MLTNGGLSYIINHVVSRKADTHKENHLKGFYVMAV